VTGEELRDLRRRSAAAVWHPFTEMGSFASSDFPVIVSAKGSVLRDASGREYLDGTSSWWCANLGHGHEGIVSAIREQAATLQHTLLGGATHPRAVEAAERLSALAPRGLGHAMFAADGTLSVEAAMKIALQYRHNRGEEGRTGFVSLSDGYHGDSLAAVGAGYIDGFHRPFLPALRRTLSALSPHCARCPFGLARPGCGVRCFDSMAEIVAEHHRSLTAVLVEPLCQAAAGMRIYPPEYLVRLRELCDRHGLLLVADEIATGFYRTGAPFACDVAGIRPDLMTVGKGLTGGTVPMSAALATDEVFDAFLPAEDGTARTFFHGTTFCGNPVTAAAACAALSAYGEVGFAEGVAEGSHRLAAIVERLSEALGGSYGASLGMIGMVEIGEGEGGAERARRIVRKAFEEGLMIRPLGPVLYLWPPLTATAAELERMGEILAAAARGTSAR
jgi:adenosylmethionine-8-amino-7-oxononanoate aminotransferase